MPRSIDVDADHRETQGRVGYGSRRDHAASPVKLPFRSPIEVPLGRHLIQWDIPGARSEPGAALARMGQADEAGPAPVVAVAQKREGAVVIAAAHPEAVAVGVEADQGDQEQVERPDRYAPAAPRFGDAETVGPEPGAGVGADEPESAPASRAQDRQAAVPAGGIGTGEQWTGVGLAVRGPVDPDAARAAKPQAGPQHPGQGLGMTALHPWRECPAGSAQLPTLGPRVGVGCVIEQCAGLT